MDKKDLPIIIMQQQQQQSLDGCGCGGCLTLIVILFVMSAVSSCMAGI